MLPIKVQKFIAFTLAEMLIAMLIVTLVAVATVPVIKKAKSQSENLENKNYWYCTRDINNRIIVQSNIASTKGQNADSCKFIPPAGVKKLNVTVVGAGGGGASGKAGIGTKKVFVNGLDDDFYQFTPTKSQRYDIITIGAGGGGGGGGSLAGRGGSGNAGCVMIAKQKQLEANRTYFAEVGQGAKGGQGDSFWDIIKVVATGFGFVHIIPGIGYIASEAYDFVINCMISIGAWTLDNWQRNDKYDGGGYGMPSAFIDTTGNKIIASSAGGAGGDFRYWGWSCHWYGCYPKKKWSGNHGNDIERQKKSTGGGCTGKTNADICVCGDQMDRDTVCSVSGNNINCADGLNNDNFIKQLAVDDISEIGKGGRGGSNGHGSDGNNGLVQISASDIYAGGEGQSGNMTTYTYNRIPAINVDVYPGKGGVGADDYNADGTSGETSRYGTKIFANGGLAGKAQQYNDYDEISTASQNTQTILGRNGEISPLSRALLNEISISQSYIDMYFGGLQTNNTQSLNATGHSANYRAIPGSGGGSGAAKSTITKNGANYQWGKGGNGSPGIIILTW